MEVINIFCDASIDINRKVACGGCFISMQTEYGEFVELGNKMMIQENATNNSSEIMAIWIGVVEAYKLRKHYPHAVFRLFSDSKISLYGLRDWLKNWIRNMDADGNLISSQGTVVANQQYFIEIFNTIVKNNLKIELYHQRGHVGGAGSKMTLPEARVKFIRANKVPPESLGVNIEYLCEYNNKIDNATRMAVQAYCNNGVLVENTSIEMPYPLMSVLDKDKLPQYISCIDKRSVISHHNFMNGYNQ